jgi:hypothetical protein
MESKDLFSNFQDVQGRYSAHAHLAQIISFLGPPDEDCIGSRNLRQVSSEPKTLDLSGGCVRTFFNTSMANFLMIMVRFEKRGLLKSLLC